LFKGGMDVNIKAKIESNKTIFDDIKNEFDIDSRKKIGAILDILTIGNISIAHARLMLRSCEHLLDNSTVALNGS